MIQQIYAERQYDISYAIVETNATTVCGALIPESIESETSETGRSAFSSIEYAVLVWGKGGKFERGM